MSEMIEIKNALEALRSEVEAKSPRLEVIERCNKFLDTQEVKNQELTKSNLEATRAADELKSKFAALETELLKPNLKSEEKSELELQVKAMDEFCKSGVAEKKYLRTDNNANGGYLVQPEYLQEIIKEITEISNVRSVARIVNSTAKQVQISVRKTLAAVASVGEGSPASASNSTYGLETLQAHKYVGRTDYTIEMLRFSPFNIEAQIRSDLAEDLARQEGADFINGNGVNKATGMLFDTRIGELNSGSASTLGNGDVLMKIQGETKTGYNDSFIFNRNTLHSHIRTLKGTTNGHYLVFFLGLVGLISSSISSALMSSKIISLFSGADSIALFSNFIFTAFSCTSSPHFSLINTWANTSNIS